MPRATSMYERRAALGTDARADGELNVLPHGMPDRAVLVARQRDGPLDGVSRNFAFDDDLEREADEAMRILRRAIGHQTRAQRAERVPRAREDVCDVGRHAAGD